MYTYRKPAVSITNIHGGGGRATVTAAAIQISRVLPPTPPPITPPKTRNNCRHASQQHSIIPLCNIVITIRFTTTSSRSCYHRMNGHHPAKGRNNIAVEHCVDFTRLGVVPTRAGGTSVGRAVSSGGIPRDYNRKSHNIQSVSYWERRIWYIICLIGKNIVFGTKKKKWCERVVYSYVIRFTRICPYTWHYIIIMTQTATLAIFGSGHKIAHQSLTHVSAGSSSPGTRQNSSQALEYGSWFVFGDISFNVITNKMSSGVRSLDLG